MKIAIATRNPIKQQAVERVFACAYPAAKDLRIVASAPPATAAEQPIDGKVAAGAASRARTALEEIGADLGVGIETGLLRIPGTDRRVNAPVCAIVDRSGQMTFGLGPGFELPDALERLVLSGRPLHDAACDALGVEPVDGVVSVLTAGRIDRRELTEAAVWMALVPRLAPLERFQ